MKQIRKLKLRSQTHYALFRADLPFKPKVEKDKTKFKRQSKHKAKLDKLFFLFILFSSTCCPADHFAISKTIASNDKKNCS